MRDLHDHPILGNHANLSLLVARILLSREPHCLEGGGLTLASIFGHTLKHLRQWKSHSIRTNSLTRSCELLANAIHFAVDGSLQRGEPFIVHHERLNLGHR